MNLISIGHNAWNEEKEDWQGLAAHVAALAQNTRSGLIVFNPPNAELPFSYYFQRYDLDLETQGYPEDDILLHPFPKHVNDLNDLLAGRPYVWIVQREEEGAGPESPIKAWLDTNGYVRRGGYYQNSISVLGYTRWDILADRPPSTRAETEEKSKPTIFLPVIFAEAADEAELTVYVVQRGDTLLAVARRFNTTVEALLRANDIPNPDRISVGQELIVP